jgi:two-component system cell cycle sensor histidine kinase/response regulator CckA
MITTVPAERIDVLLIEDSAPYAELLLHELRLGGYEPQALRVETPEDTLAALDEARWDIIFADANLPRFRGADVLGMLRDRGLDTPVIMISGTIGEEEALEVLHAGAKDFISKDTLVRLLPGVGRELGAAAGRAALHKAQLIIETMTDGVWMLDDEDRTTFANRSFCELLGHPAADLVGAPGLAHVHPDDQALVREGHGRIECRLLHRDGDQLDVLVRATALEHEDGRRAGSLLLVTDVTEEKRAGQALRTAEQRYSTLLEHIPLVTYVDAIDAASLNIFSSPQIETLLGYSRQEWQSDPTLFVKLLHPEDRERVLAEHSRSHETSERLKTEYRMIARDGRVVHVRDEGVIVRDEAGEPLYLQGFLLDITEQRRLEKELHESQKLEALGEFASAFAHDFNNMLLAIEGSAEMAAAQLDQQLTKKHELRTSIEMISEATKRARGLAQSLLAFGRNHQLEPAIVDLNELIAKMESLLGRVASGPIELQVDRFPTPCLVLVDAGRLEQAILNLVINARDAMTDGGRLTIGIDSVSFDKAATPPSVELDARSYCRISVSDTGVGIDEATRAKIFEPFFTTKGERGTGLGLSTVYGFVTQSDGAVVVSSEVGEGTRVEIYLPAVSR